MKKRELKYLEPVEYFPITIRKKHRLGEFAEQEKLKVVKKISKK